MKISQTKKIKLLPVNDLKPFVSIFHNILSVLNAIRSVFMNEVNNLPIHRTC